MPELAQRLAEFAAHVDTLAGDEHRAFCDRLFHAFGWPDLRTAGAAFEAPNRLLWGQTLLLELHPRGTGLAGQARRLFEHWQYHTPHPRYVALCDFAELVLHDFAGQLWEPIDRLPISTLPREHAALSFLRRDPRPPVFRNDRVAVTRDAAGRLADLSDLLVARGIDRDVARRIALGCVHTLFAAGLGLTPAERLEEFLLAELRHRRSIPGSAFASLRPLELTAEERDLVTKAAGLDWSRVQLPVFGDLFQRAMDPERRHALGAHFTSEADIQRIVLPSLVRPWRERIAAAATHEALRNLHHELARLRVLDPACGSGNILCVAYRELLRLEVDLLARLHPGTSHLSSACVSLANLSGIDRDPFAVELARITLQLADAQARRELRLAPSPPNSLPDLRVADALFTDWPAADVILGNPPFQAKNNMQREFGPEYLRRLRHAYPDVSGRADYCVYWFRRAHDHLPPGGRAGLVGTNTIRQNQSRDSGLGHITAGGTITEAVAAKVWSGDAAVNVSIVNWLKEPDLPGKKFLSWQAGDAAHSPWHTVTLDRIGPALSPDTDVSGARTLRVNLAAACCYQGQTVGHDGFLLASADARRMLADAGDNAAVLFPYLGGDDLLGRRDGAPSRHVIDFGERDLRAAEAFAAPFARVATTVLPARRDAAAEEQRRNADLLRADPEARINRHHAAFLDRWWRLSWRRGEMLAAIAALARYVACVRVTRRPIFEFVSPQIRPSDALVVFALDDDYSFGVLQSALHWQWFTARCSTLKRDYRYTSSTVWGAFPWPQAPSARQISRIAEAARTLRQVRAAALERHDLSRRELYRTLDPPGPSPLRDAHEALDEAVRAAYGLRGDPLRFLLDLNVELAERERSGQAIIGPGLAALAPDAALRAACSSTDCIAPP
ncbi:Type II restriction/modification system, DNA methylase subunit YeeA [Nannocystis exedens]|uniref:site-specific DNA-methyltransferase (adenine-specific) n=1 Tax=Nannocystis exedens TaxID=54 RepID=A0A1I1V4B4_9BACT|nr:DNA methyltransferase [Nannocystis exedens]PCC72331.1 N-6 DNA Methylase [Nannocystis exedens]SFD77739.1 Type II restriction/modification system, DNA methylase subunit YeeA [Nannocystis exedens]